MYGLVEVPADSLVSCPPSLHFNSVQSLSWTHDFPTHAQYAHVCTHTHTHVLHTCTHTIAHMHMHTQLHTCAHNCTHAHTLTCTNTHLFSFSPPLWPREAPHDVKPHLLMTLDHSAQYLIAADARRMVRVDSTLSTTSSHASPPSSSSHLLPPPLRCSTFSSSTRKGA